jgi:hypothetical protein
VGVGGYLLGSALAIALVVPLAYGAWSLRAALVPHWSGGPARLAEIVIALATVVVLAEILGAARVLERAALVPAAVAAGAALAIAGRRSGSTTTVTVRTRQLIDGSGSPRVEIAGALAAVTVVAAQWAGKIGDAFGRGMTNAETLAYHGPYAATFAQRGRVLDLLDPADPLHGFAGHTAELLHTIAIVTTGRDVLSPLVNAGWAGLALLGAWCIGRRNRVGALCVLGAAVVLGLPTVAATHPGQGSNDVAAAALLLAAIALLMEGRLALAPTAIAGLAAGLAVGTKVTTGASVAVLSIGVIVVIARRARWRVAIAWWLAMLTTGGFWFVRNVVVVDNPIPYYTFDFGLFEISGVPQPRPGALADQLLRRDFWGDVLLPDLRVALGAAWPLLLVLALAGMVLPLGRRQPALQRLAALAALGGFVAYLFTPNTANDLAFASNVRYATPALLAALTIQPLALAERRVVWRRLTMVALLAIVAADAAATHHERVPAWPAAALVAGPLAALVVAATAGAWVALRRRASPLAARAAVAVATAAVAGIVAIGYPVQRHYLDRRYEDAGLPLDTVYRAMRDVHDARVAAFGTSETYPLFGRDVSNDVDRPVRPEPFPEEPAARCLVWLERLLPYDYVVIAHDPFLFEGPVEDTVAGDTGVVTVAGDARGTLYRIAGSFGANRC